MPRKDRRPSRPSARPQTRSHGHQPQRPQSPKRGASPRQASGIWLYGLHAVKAALANPRRKLHRAVLTERAAEEIGAKLLGRVRHETADADAVGKLLPPGAVHQGVALNCEPLPQRDLEEVLGAPARDAAGQPVAGRRRIVLVLDQLSDPHNTGAILRSAAAFGASAVVVQDRHAPPEAGALAKAASGALDSVPYVSVVNIARALDELAKLGFWRIALAGDGEMDFREAVNNAGDVALVLGSEGAGIRRLVREHCDTAAFLPIESAMESLNVSNAAAIALYELRR
ncbi:MAG: 23S rRNA (guanosine(2251)-2'-O)-methyltransferase RlmB [Alphaproteobacteria bacterium]|nr:23S rRNA (guanosine(2251)-2'-O)-methyltransferase RlmB [Alphaproteobacteria bacterium]